MTAVYSFNAQQMDGKTVSLKQFQGRVMLIVNTASACGFTPQFAGLEELHQRFGKDGQVIKRYAPTDKPAGMAKDIAVALAS